MDIYEDLESLLDALPLKDGLRISFHHHLRDGDGVINPVLFALKKRGVKDIHLYASSIFPNYKAVQDLIESGHIKNITTNYLNGPVAKYISEHGLKGTLKMQSHGGRARAFKEKENTVDIAFIAAPAINRDGAISGCEGKNAFGSIGYACEDAAYATLKVAITDNLMPIKYPQIKKGLINHLLHVDSIGDVTRMASGTLMITKDPVGLKIARTTMAFLDTVKAIKNDVSFQSGAGGTSLSITKMFNDYLKAHHLQASFYSGGITKLHVDALENGLVRDLYDVQCFDLIAVKSLMKNTHHHFMSANDYANPNTPGRIIRNLDIVILGASEIDLNFNVNVTTDSNNRLIGGSGGHSDTAEDAKLTIIVSPLIRARTVLIKDRVNTCTTKGMYVDVLVTERGIAINPRRKDLLKAVEGSTLDVLSIEKLQKKAYTLTGVPSHSDHKKTPIGMVEDRHGHVQDTLYKKE